MPTWKVCLLLVWGAVAVPISEGKDDSTEILPVRSEMVPMRDGNRLETDIYLPSEEGPFPVVLMRSTYGRKLGNPESWTQRGYALVVQDVRGRGGSEGRDQAFYADGWRPKFMDGADTVAWIRSQPWCNGKIGSHGGSALGITQTLMAPATKGLTCQYIDSAASAFYGQLSYQGGVFRKKMCEGWLSLQKIPDVIDLWKSHPSYDPFWSYYNAEEVVERVSVPALHVGGWQDIFAKGTIQSFVTRQTSGGKGARGNQKLIMKWSPHGPDVSPDFSWPKSRFDVRVSHEVRRFFDYWLKGIENGVMDEPAVNYYAVGDDRDETAPGMEWRTGDSWPPCPTREMAYYLEPRRTMSLEKPRGKPDKASFHYDPEDPFPTHGGANLFLPSGPFDQRTVNAGRKDLLAFATKPLDKPLEIVGPLRTTLYVSTNCPDTDFTAKVVDIYPKGDEREILMIDGIQRVKYRDGYRKPCPLLESEEEVVRVEVDLWNLCWVVNRGHRLGLQVSSSNYPRFEKNPNTGEDFPKEGESYPVARNTIHMGPEHPSALWLSVSSN